MRKLAFTLVPLLVLACDRQPVALDVATAPAFRATVEWINWEFPYPAEGASYGPVPCLPGTPEAIAFGTVGIREHNVTTPDAVVRDKWSNPYLSADFRLVIAGVTWPLYREIRHGVEYYVDGTLVRAVGGTSMMSFKNEVTGEILTWSYHWSFTWDSQGNLTFSRFKTSCDVR